MTSNRSDDDDDENAIILTRRGGRRAREDDYYDDDETTSHQNRRTRFEQEDQGGFGDQGVFGDQHEAPNIGEGNLGNEYDATDAAAQPAVEVHPTATTAVVPTPLPSVLQNTIGIAAALSRAYPTGFPQDLIHEELQMQADIKGDATAAAAFRTEILQHQGITVFAFLQPKDMTIHLLHSPAPYYARGATGPLKGKDIGFVGDRSEFNSPAPIILQPEKPWKWITKNVVTNDTTLEYYYANPRNVGKLFVPAVGAVLTRVTAPRLLLLPSNLIKYCVDAPRTAWNLHQYIMTLMGGPGINPQNYALVADWCRLALHNDNGDSPLQYDLQAAASNEVFQRWARTRIDAVLGPSRSTITTPSHQPTLTQDLTQLSSIAAEFGKGVMEALRPPNATATMASVLGTTQTGDGSKDYDKYQKAIIQGFSHSPTLAGVQPIWELFSQTKNIDTHRLHLREAMQKWAAKWGVTITRGIHLPKIAIEDIVHLRFNPGGSVAYYASADKGISLLLCRNRPGEDRESARLRELAEEQSGANITLAEALSIRRNAPQPPPDNYIELKTCIGTFCAMLWALFGDHCEYLRKLHEIYTCLDSDRVTECWANFTPSLCRQIAWAIIDDGREYFSQTMLPDRFLGLPGGYITFPRSSLEELIRPIMRQSPIISATFPSQWLTRTEITASSVAATSTWRPQTASAAPATVPLATVVAATRTHTTGSNNSTTTRLTSAAASTTSSLTAASTQQRGIRQTNVHPTIKALLEPFILRHGQLQLTRIMMVAGVTWPEMPKIERLVENGTNNLCYNYVLGKCTSRYCTKRRAGHITEVPDGFATSVCNTLRPGVVNMTEELMTMPWPDFQAAIANRRPHTE